MTLANAQQQRLLERLRLVQGSSGDGARRAQPGARRSSACTPRAGYPCAAGPTTTQQPLRPAGPSRSLDFVVRGPRSGSRPRTWRPVPRLGRWTVVSRAPQGVRGAEPFPVRALFAARRRVDALVAIVPADPIARRRITSQHLLNDTRARSTNRSTQTPLPHTRRLQKAILTPDCSSQPRIVASIICHNDQNPIPPPTICLTVLAADRSLDLQTPPSGPRGSCRRSHASARIRRPRIVARGRSSR